MNRLAILDDYQGVALDLADWTAVRARCEIEVLREPVADRAILAERLAGVGIVLAMRERTAFDAAMLDRLPDLRLLVTTGMVNKSIDIAAAQARGITVCGTPSGGPSAAELAFGLILALARRIPQDAWSIRDGEPRWQTGLGRDLAGQVLGIAGFGRLGKQMARYGAAFGMDCLAWSRSLTEEQAKGHGVRRAETLAALLQQADVVTLHLPQTPATVGILGAAELAGMKPGALLVNTSRGPLVDEAALVAALRAGALGGAGLDVFDIEPLPLDHPYRSAPNLIATPHMGYVTEQTYRHYFAGAVEAILGWLDGAPVRVLSP